MSNPNSLPWLHYQDAQLSDKNLKDIFNQHMNSGRYAEALALLKENEAQLKGKAYVAETVNKIFTGVFELQKYFNDGVNIFLSDLANFYFKAINDFIKKGAWNNSVQYSIYNFVEYNDDIFMAFKVPPIGTAPTNSEYWIKLGLKGDKGASGIDVTMQYEWSSFKKYNINDLVVYKKNIYVAIKANTNALPDVDESSWIPFLIISKGKINVGTTPPTKLVQNTIWFKTKVDPLQSNTDVSGEFYCYKLNGDWEIMYPATVFNWVQGIKEYSSKVIKKTQAIVGTWKQIDGKYQYSLYNNNIKENSFVEVRCVRDRDFTFFSTLNLSVIENYLIFTTSALPPVTLFIDVIVQ